MLADLTRKYFDKTGSWRTGPFVTKYILIFYSRCKRILNMIYERYGLKEIFLDQQSKIYIGFICFFKHHS